MMSHLKPAFQRLWRRHDTVTSDINLAKRIWVHRKYRDYNRMPFVEKWKRINIALSLFGYRSTGNTMQIYYDTGDAFQAMWDSIDAAHTSVQWQTYILKDDHVGRTTVRKLEEAVDRGVQVELLYDCGGNITGRSRLTKGLRARNAQVTTYRPFFVTLWKYLYNGMNWKDSPTLRNHRKILIVDDKVAFAGGLNIGDDYCAVTLGGNGRFRDVHCRVTGPAVRDLQLFYKDTTKPINSTYKPWKLLTSTDSLVDRLLTIGRRARSELLSRDVLVGQMNEGLQKIKEIAETSYDKTIKVGRASRQYALGTANHRKNVNKRFAEIISKAKLTKHERALLLKYFNERVRYAQQFLLETVRDNLSELEKEAAEVTDAMSNYEETACDDKAIPEVQALADTPRITQILCNNPIRLDWSIPMAFCYAVKLAHRRVWITTPYYVPHRKLTRAVITAARRGVDVRIIAGSRKTTDPWFMWYSSQHVTMRFLEAGVRIYEFNGGQIMHAKTVVVDSIWSSVGSYNWDVLSNKLMEIGVFTFSAEDATVLENYFNRDIEKSKEITKANFGKRSVFRRIQCAFFYYGMRICEKIGFWNYYDPYLSTEVD